MDGRRRARRLPLILEIHVVGRAGARTAEGLACELDA